jgi:hypothetical protein
MATRKAPETATHKTLYYTGTPEQYMYYKRHELGHWLYLSIDRNINEWLGSNNKPEFYKGLIEV